MKTKVETTKAPQAVGPYSQAIIIESFVFTSGQIHITPDGKFVGGTVEEKTHQVMKNLKEILETSGVTFADVVKVTIYITNMDDYAKLNAIYSSYMSAPFPARETVCVKALPMGATLEISMIAVKS